MSNWTPFDVIPIVDSCSHCIRTVTCTSDYLFVVVEASRHFLPPTSHSGASDLLVFGSSDSDATPSQKPVFNQTKFHRKAITDICPVLFDASSKKATRLPLLISLDVDGNINFHRWTRVNENDDEHLHGSPSMKSAKDPIEMGEYRLIDPRPEPFDSLSSLSCFTTTIRIDTQSSMACAGIALASSKRLYLFVVQKGNIKDDNVLYFSPAFDEAEKNATYRPIKTPDNVRAITWPDYSDRIFVMSKKDYHMIAFQTLQHQADDVLGVTWSVNISQLCPCSRPLRPSTLFLSPIRDGEGKSIVSVQQDDVTQLLSEKSAWQHKADDCLRHSVNISNSGFLASSPISKSLDLVAGGKPDHLQGPDQIHWAESPVWIVNFGAMVLACFPSYKDAGKYCLEAAMLIGEGGFDLKDMMRSPLKLNELYTPLLMHPLCHRHEDLISHKRQVIIYSIDSVCRIVFRNAHELIDELMAEHKFDLALVFAEHRLDSVDLSDKTLAEPNNSPLSTICHIRVLQAKDQFQKGLYGKATETFIELDVEPQFVLELVPGVTPWYVFNPCSLCPSPSSSLDISSEDICDCSEDFDAAVLSSLKPLQESGDTAAVDALIMYLTSQRNKLLSHLKHLHESTSFEGSQETGRGTLGGVRSNVDGASMSSFSSYSLRVPADPVDVAEVEQRLRLLDTSLLRCYLLFREAMVPVLLRLQNYCSLHETSSLLRAMNKRTELLTMFEKKGIHRSALQILHRERHTSQLDPLKRVSLVTLYLKNVLGADLNLVFEQLLLLKADENQRCDRALGVDFDELWLKFFCSEAAEQCDRLKVSQFMLDNGDCPYKMAILYIKHCLYAWEDETTRLHTLLVTAYLDALDSCSDRTDNLVSELRKFLEDPNSKYDGRMILPRLSSAPEDVSLLREKAMVLIRLGRYNQAFQLMLGQSSDLGSAIRAALAVDGNEALGCLVHMMLQRPVRSDWVDQAIYLLNAYPSRLDVLSLLPLIPGDVKMADLSNFLNHFMQMSLDRSRETELLKSTHSSRLLHLKKQLVYCEQQSFIVDGSKACKHCKRRLDCSAVVRFPNGAMAHLSCCHEDVSSKKSLI